MLNKIYLIHCGYYDEEVSNGIFEFHINIPVVAETLQEAKEKVRKNTHFLSRKMHIDGIQEIEKIDGYKIQLIATGMPTAETQVHSHCHRDL